jgi:hypothetical protein
MKNYEELALDCFTPEFKLLLDTLRNHFIVGHQIPRESYMQMGKEVHSFFNELALKNKCGLLPIIACATHLIYLQNDLHETIQDCIKRN